MITAPSKNGKTTLLNQIIEISNDTFVVNGDKPLIGFAGGANEIYAYGTPWSGKEQLNTNVQVSLKIICILRRGKENSIQKICFVDALPVLLAQSYRPENPVAYGNTIKLIKQLKDKVKSNN